MGDLALKVIEGTEFGAKLGRFMIEPKSKNQKIEVSGEVGEQLLPGLPNEITLDHVATKLPWTAFHMLSSVSSGWQHAIQSRQVYDARVRTQSTQTLVATNQQDDKNVAAIGLFSLSDGSGYCLPPIPGLSQGIPWLCQCSSLGGKLYVFGGVVGTIDRAKRMVQQASKKVYVFDLVGQKQWKQCASMAEPRAQFGCGVINGKIYVFGGTSTTFKFVSCGSEVYDPEVDVWSPIAPMGSPGLYQQVVAVGEELFVHTELSESCGTVLSRDYKGFPLEVYNPLKNQWRSMGMDELIKFWDMLLVVGGKLHKLNANGGIVIYDTCANTWNLLQSCSFGVLEPTDPLWVRVRLLAALAVDDEIFCVVWCITSDHDQKIHLMRSQGLGCQNKDIEWQKLECSRSFNYNWYSNFFRPIQL